MNYFWYKHAPSVVKWLMQYLLATYSATWYQTAVADIPNEQFMMTYIVDLIITCGYL